MNWVSDYIFDPVEFYSRVQKKSIGWLLALSGLSLCITLRVIDFLIIATKSINNLNQTIDQLNSSYRLDPLTSYGISIFGSINIWIVWLIYLLFLICIDIIVREGRNYLNFVKASLLSFYSMIPYLIFVFVLALIYEPTDFELPRQNNLDIFINWIQEVSLQTSLQTIPTLIRNFEYFFDVWIVALITASYKAFSGKSYLFCGICGSIYLVMILSIGLLN